MYDFVSSSTEPLLASAMLYTTKECQAMSPSVNSVHWNSPNEETKPSLVEITARTEQDDALAPLSRQSAKMKPADRSVTDGYTLA